MAAGLSASLLAAASPPPSERALIAEPSPPAREAIRAGLTRLISAPVLLGDDVFSRDSTLVVDRSHLTGRDIRRPDVFTLRKSGETCYLRREADLEMIVIPGLQCRPESARIQR